MSRPVSPADHLRKAEQALESCHVLLKSGDTEGACNRAYYAMFNAAHVALQTVGTIQAGMVYKSHSGLIGAFSKEVVLSGKIDKALGRSLAKVYEMRLIADYVGDAPEEDDARWAAAQAEVFVAVVRTAFGS